MVRRSGVWSLWDLLPLLINIWYLKHHSPWLNQSQRGKKRNIKSSWRPVSRCSSVQLPNTLPPWPQPGVYGLFWGDSSGNPSARLSQGWHCPLLPFHAHLATHSCIFQALLALQAYGTSWKLFFGFDSWESPLGSSRAGAGKAGEEHSQVQA